MKRIIPPEYGRLEKLARLENVEEVRASINTISVIKKIENWAFRFGLEPEFVRYKVITDETFAIHFAKDPAKQSFHQKVASEHIKRNIPLIHSFKCLPALGDDAQYINGGFVVSGKQIHAFTSYHGKSIDFSWLYRIGEKELVAYATHKHTKQEGGSQDNQFNDVKSFLVESMKCKSPDLIFFAICDGEYYRRPSSRGVSRIAELSRDYPGGRTRVCSIDDLPKLWGMVIVDWAKHHNIEIPEDDISHIDVLLD